MTWLHRWMEKIHEVFSEKKTEQTRQDPEFPIFYEPLSDDAVTPKLGENVVIKEKPKKKKKTTRKKKNTQQ